MGIPKEKSDELFSYRDYLQWPEDERWELINGIAYNMSPAPNRMHQLISGNLSFQIRKFLESKQCQVYCAPFDVLFPKDEEDEGDINTVIQPDIVVYCDISRLTEKGATGAPDFVVEILSPSTSRRDQSVKFDLYAANGVKEYWIVDPAGQWVNQYLLTKKGNFDNGNLFVNTGLVKSSTLKGFELEIEMIFNT